MLKYTGVVRPVDHLGRLVIPRDIRRQLDVREGHDQIEMYINDKNEVVLRKYKPCCLFCYSMDELVTFGDSLVCRSCIEKLESLKDTAVSLDDPE